jgi:hypothetical protein
VDVSETSSRQKGTGNFPNFLNSGPKRPSDAKLTRHPFQAVGRIDVLDQNNLIASSAALAGNNRSPREEYLPDLSSR